MHRKNGTKRLIEMRAYFRQLVQTSLARLTHILAIVTICAFYHSVADSYRVAVVNINSRRHIVA